MSLHRCRPILLCGLLFLATPPLRAADDPAPATPVAPAADKPVAKEAASASTPPREQTIYIPYEKLRQTFEKEGRGVFIPYERFQELVEGRARARAQARRAQAADARGDHPGRQRSHGRQGSGPGRGAAQDRLVGQRLGRSSVAPGRRGRDFGQPNLARRQGRAGAIGGRCRRRLQAGDRKQDQSAAANRFAAGICQGIQQNAGPQRRFVRRAASPGESLEGADSGERRESAYRTDDRGHRTN